MNDCWLSDYHQLSLFRSKRGMVDNVNAPWSPGINCPGGMAVDIHHLEGLPLRLWPDRTANIRHYFYVDASCVERNVKQNCSCNWKGVYKCGPLGCSRRSLVVKGALDVARGDGGDSDTPSLQVCQVVMKFSTICPWNGSCQLSNNSRYGMYFWLPLYLNHTLGFAQDMSGYISTIFDVGCAAGGPLLGHINDRFASKTLAIISAAALVGAATMTGICSSANAALICLCLLVLGATNHGSDLMLGGEFFECLDDVVWIWRVSGLILSAVHYNASKRGVITVVWLPQAFLDDFPGQARGKNFQYLEFFEDFNEYSRSFSHKL